MLPILMVSKPGCFDCFVKSDQGTYFSVLADCLLSPEHWEVSGETSATAVELWMHYSTCISSPLGEANFFFGGGGGV